MIGAPMGGSKTLGAIEHRYGTSKKLAEEGTKEALSKVKEMKQQKQSGTLTGKPAVPVVMDPPKSDVIGQPLTN